MAIDKVWVLAEAGDAGRNHLAAARSR